MVKLLRTLWEKAMITCIPRRPLTRSGPAFRAGARWAAVLTLGLLSSTLPAALAQPAATPPAAPTGATTTAAPAATPSPAAPAPAPATAAPAAKPATAPTTAAPAAKPATAPTTAAPATKPAPAAAATSKPAKPTPAAPAAGKPGAAASAGTPAAGSPAAATASAAADRPVLTRVVDSIQKVYENTGNLKARFAQTLTSAMGKRQASGVLRLKKPGKMRWDYEKPEKKLFVTDGAMLWMYEPEDEQAFRQPLNSSQLPAQVSFLFGKGRLSDEFDITYLDGQAFGQAGDLVLKLVPKKATAQYKHLIFVVDPKTFMVKETVLYDQQGGTNHIVFSAIETNLKTDIDDSRFSFTPPPNTKIINPR